MTNQEILEKAISLAIDGGWQHYSFGGHIQNLLDEVADVDMHKCVGNSVFGVIFNHDFAKALWGIDDLHLEAEVEPTSSFDGETTEHDVVIIEVYHYENWQWHLMQMVIAEDPIAYLGENI